MIRKSWLAPGLFAAIEAQIIVAEEFPLGPVQLS
jgi:hypothetical protein